MYLPQTYRGKSALCTGACRGVEAGAGGQGWRTAERGESGLGGNQWVNIIKEKKNDEQKKLVGNIDHGAGIRNDGCWVR